MNWLKRNLFMAVGALVALALLGVAGLYMFSQYQRDVEVSDKLQAATELFKKLNERKPSVIREAGQTNIAAAKIEQKRLENLLERQHALFTPVATHTNIDSASFKSLLETTIDGLQKLATRQGVRIPNNYSFTFSSQRQTLVFDPQDLMPWSLQLLEIKSLCEAVFQARVHSVASIRRAPMTKRDGGYTILGRKATTNTVVAAVQTPYELVFQGFTPELAEVLDNLLKSPQCFIVKNINVEQASATVETSATEAAAVPAYTMDPAAAAPVRPQSAAETMRSRYGIGVRGGPAAPVAPAPVLAPAMRATTGRRTETVLDEKLLKFTVLLEAVRLKETTPTK